MDASGELAAPIKKPSNPPGEASANTASATPSSTGTSVGEDIPHLEQRASPALVATTFPEPTVAKASPGAEDYTDSAEFLAEREDKVSGEKDSLGGGDSEDSGSELQAFDDDELEYSLEDEDGDPTRIDHLLEELEDGLKYDPGAEATPSGEPLVSIPLSESKEIVDFLNREGSVEFMGKYVLVQPQPYSMPELLAALGFPLRLSVLESFPPTILAVGLQLAMRHVMSVRPRLPSPRTLDEVVALIEKASNIVVITGAGISTSLGIPDFRSQNGLYKRLESRLDELGIAEPQMVFDYRTFLDDPSVFYRIAHVIYDPNFTQYSPTHQFIRMLHEHGKLLRNYTQNIENLETKAGIPGDRVVQCHGAFTNAMCVTCGYEESCELMADDIKNERVHLCPRCHALTGDKRSASKQLSAQPESDDEDEGDESPSYGVMKPEIVFFGESLPRKFDQALFETVGEKGPGDSRNCDLVICIGTSLEVAPVSEIVKVVPRDIPQIYVSLRPARHNNFDVTFLGPCDDVVELLSQKLGWELKNPMSKRTEPMPDDKYPGGYITNEDGVYEFHTFSKEATYPVTEPPARADTQTDESRDLTE